jgi:hypothetical protein
MLYDLPIRGPYSGSGHVPSAVTCAARKLGRGFDLGIRLLAAVIAVTLAECLSRWLT